jgi:hypothetical protein
MKRAGKARRTFANEAEERAFLKRATQFLATMQSDRSVADFPQIHYSGHRWPE